MVTASEVGNKKLLIEKFENFIIQSGFGVSYHYGWKKFVGSC